MESLLYALQGIPSAYANTKFYLWPILLIQMLLVFLLAIPLVVLAALVLSLASFTNPLTNIDSILEDVL